MTNTYNTLNPLGSTNPKDLYDNASNFDEAMNSLGPAFYDRFNRRRETWAGFETRFNTSISNWDAEFQAFLAASGFEPVHLVYIDGSPLTVDRPTQLIDRAGQSYRIKLPSSFPVILTGTWATDLTKLVDVADAGFKSDLASTDLSKGASLVGRALIVVNSVAELLTFAPTTDGVVVYLKGFYAGTPGLGEGVLTWQASSSLTADGGTVFKPTAVVGNGRFVRPMAEFRFEDFGCIGDDSTDNTANLNAAFAAPRAPKLTSQMGRLARYRHSGTIYITKPVEFNSGYAEFVLNDPSGLLDNFRVGDNITQINGVNWTHNTISRVQPGGVGTCGIRLYYSGVCKFYESRIYGNNKIQNGILISRGIINDFVGMYIDNCINYGVFINGTDAGAGRSIDQSFYRNRIEGGVSGLVTSDFTEGLFGRHNIIFNTSGHGVVFDATTPANAGASFKWQDNDNDTCGLSGLYVDKIKAFLIGGNWFSNNSGVEATGITVGAFADGGLIDGNLSIGTAGCRNMKIEGANITFGGANRLVVGTDGVYLGTTAVNFTMSGASVGYMSGYAVNAFLLPDGLLIDSSNRFNNIGQAQPVGLPNSQAGSYSVQPFGGFNAVVTYDPPSLAAGAIITTIVPLASAQFGDYVDVSFSVATNGVKLSGTVTAVGNVEVLLHNATASTVDVPSGLLRVSLRKLR
jgi:hypothetical protein